MSAPAVLPSNFSGGVTITDETIALVRQAREAELTRAINLATGLIGYDLAAPAQVVVPIYTPLLNSIPRVKGVGVDIHHFKSITSFGWNGIVGTVDENQSPAEVTYSLVNLYNVFQTIGAGNSVSFKAQWRGRLLEGDIRAKRMAELLYALKLIEESWLVTMADYLWAPPAPLAPTTATTGGTIAAGTYYFAVSANSANGETFATQAVASVTTVGTTSTITLTIFTVPNAISYNVYVSTTGAGSTWSKQVTGNFVGGIAVLNQPANTMLGSFTVTLSSLTTGSNIALPAANGAIVAKGANNLPLTFNGLLALIFGAGNLNYAGPNQAPNSLFSAAGQNLSGLSSLGLNTMQPIVIQPAASTGKLAYSDITTLLLQMWLNARANPDVCWVSAQDNITLANLLANATGTRFVIDTTQPNSQNDLLLGSRVTRMVNPTTGKVISIEVLPFLPQGTLIFGSRSLPYPVSGFDGPVMKVIENQTYYGLDYLPTKSNPQFSFADYVDETLEISFLGGFGAITGIIPG
jgi:hypothetical protein